MKKLLALAVCLTALGIATTVKAPFTLLFGWIGFLWRVLPETTVHGSSVGVGCAAFVLFAGGVHWAGTNWRRRKPSEQAESAGVWKLRWSLAIVVGVCVLFAAGISLVGIVHQGIWLFTSDRPLTQEVAEVNGADPHNLTYLGYSVSRWRESGESAWGGEFIPDGSVLHSWETRMLWSPCLSPRCGHATTRVA